MDNDSNTNNNNPGNNPANPNQANVPQAGEVVYSSAEQTNNPTEFVSDIISLKKILKFIFGGLAIAAVIFLVLKVLLPNLQSINPEKVTLTYWGLWEDKSVMEGVLSDFEREHPNIKVDYQKQDIKSLGKYIDRLTTRISNNAGPDVFRFHNSWVVQLKNILLPLSLDAVSSTEISTQYYNVIKRDMNYNGAYYGIPFEIDTLALIANTDILKAAGIDTPPSTWDELSKVSRQLTVKDDQGKIRTAGIAMGTYDNIDHASDILSMLLVQNGADMRNLGGATHKNSVDALDYYTSFAVDNAVWDNTMENSKLAFAKGKVAMMFGYSWDLIDILALNPKIQIKVFSVPHLPGKGTTIASYWAEGVSSKSKHPQEAFELLKFLSRKENLAKMYTAQTKVRLYGEPYPRMDMAELLKYNNLVYPFVLLAQDSVSTPFASTTFDDSMNAAFNGYLADAIRSINSRALSSASAIDTLAQGVNQTFLRYDK
ncbi:MAG: hypothetical protein A2857_02990 [Candidatus Levybacteria bacterium RIFCSPHIGHO2_01_FULL_36_15]|nr:MAG: hypothetical protein A2857_02990 [Candidatus Levybacteria bacterium RIFCSPHIGHO2_01_FULL_36_15]OGH37263.1 MAG: hypothetical protein A2905_05655 [Candidatus Levybacteria bacterium RIFCSPLOWO2_01_FULL_36_10]